MKKISIIFSIALLFLFSFTVNCFASTIYTLSSGIELNLPDGFPKGEPYSYFMFHNRSDGWTTVLVSYETNSYFEMVEYSNGYYKLVCRNSSGESIGFYVVGTDSRYDYWVDNIFETNPKGISDNIVSKGDILANRDIKNSDGTIFFQAALPRVLTETIMEMIAVETPEVGTKTIQTMGTILLCGVGCLALLISLPLLARVFRRYLIR